MASKGFLESVMFDEPATTNQNVQASPASSVEPPRKKKPTGRQRVKALKKNISNAEAANIARGKGAKTAPERALQSTVSEMDTLSQKQTQNLVVQKQKANLNTLMDKIGDLPPEQMFSEEGFANAKKLVPSLTREVYFNSLAPNASRRKMLTKQLAALPVGTILPEGTKENLKAAGIPEPNKYMSLSVTAPSNTLVGAIQQTAIGQAAAGESKAPLFGAGVDLLSKQKKMEEGLKTFNSEASESLKAEMAKFKALADKNQGLSVMQKASFGRSLSNDLNKLSEGLNVQFEFWKNIQDFSDTSKSFETIQLVGEDTLPGGVKVVGDDNSFQNVHDIALIYSFIKMLDPNSVVREGEVKLAEKSIGFLDSLGIKANKIFSGQTLNDQQRNGILSVANRSILNGASNFEDEIARVDTNIESFGLKRGNVISKRTDKMLSQMGKLRKGVESVDKRQAQKSRQPQQSKPKFSVENVTVEILPD
jgi:hypothetical protein